MLGPEIGCTIKFSVTSFYDLGKLPVFTSNLCSLATWIRATLRLARQRPIFQWSCNLVSPSVVTIVENLNIRHCSQSNCSHIERVCDEVDHVPPRQERIIHLERYLKFCVPRCSHITDVFLESHIPKLFDL